MTVNRHLNYIHILVSSLLLWQCSMLLVYLSGVSSARC
jgi:hypothetical protein